MPVKLGNTFIGLAGVDLSLQKFQDIIKNASTLDNDLTFLLSNNGTFVTHPNSSMIGKIISDELPSVSNTHNIIENIHFYLHIFDEGLDEVSIFNLQNN